MICHLLSELKFCFDKHWEKNSFLCEDEYLPHIKLHCSSIAGKDLQSWRQAFPIVVLARLRLASREQSVASNRNHHTTVLLQRQSSNAWTTAPSQAFSQSEIIWLTWMARALRARRRVGIFRLVAAGAQRGWPPPPLSWENRANTHAVKPISGVHFKKVKHWFWCLKRRKYRCLKSSFFCILNASFWHAKRQFKQYKRLILGF